MFTAAEIQLLERKRRQQEDVTAQQQEYVTAQQQEYVTAQQQEDVTAQQQVEDGATATPLTSFQDEVEVESEVDEQMVELEMDSSQSDEVLLTLV